MKEQHEKINLHLNSLPYYQKAAENKLLDQARELADDLCISFDQGVRLAKSMNTRLVQIAQWR